MAPDECIRRLKYTSKQRMPKRRGAALACQKEQLNYSNDLYSANFLHILADLKPYCCRNVRFSIRVL